jgi:lysophospholipase
MTAFADAQYWTASDGARLALRRAAARGERRGSLILLHGFGEHSGRYAHVAEWYAGRGIAVFALDQRGHGLSPGLRGHIARFAQYLSDIVSLRKLVAAEAPGPQLLHGQSFGGLVALRFLETSPTGVIGAVLTSPFLAVAMKVPRWKETLGNALADILPSLRVPTGINLDHLSTDPEVGRAARNDPLGHTVMTPRAYQEIKAAQRHVAEERERLRVPLFFGLAGDDRIVSRLTSQRFAGSLECDVTVRVYDGMFHEILNEPRRDEVFADLAPWLDRILEGAGAAP